MTAMNQKNIGIHAEIVWNLLCDGRKWSYGNLKECAKLRDQDLNAALGWLACENKIEFGTTEPDGTGEVEIWLREAVGSHNFFF